MSKIFGSGLIINTRQRHPDQAAGVRLHIQIAVVHLFKDLSISLDINLNPKPVEIGEIVQILH